MRDELIHEQQNAPIELGAATDLTRGFYDPVLKENFFTPEARDFP